MEENTRQELWVNQNNAMEETGQLSKVEGAFGEKKVVKQQNMNHIYKKKKTHM